MAKSLIRLCASLKMLSQSPKYLGTMRLCHTENETKELTPANLKSPSEAKKLFELLTYDSNPINLIVNIEKNKEMIDGRHVVTALTSMYKFYETNNYHPRQVTASPQFTKMCTYLNKHIRTLEVPQILQALKILNLLKISSSTTIIQNLLQLIRVSINNLHPHEIYYLTFVLKRMNPTPLGNAIYTALHEVFEARIKTKLDVEDLTELSNALKYAAYHTKTKETIKFLLQKIQEYNGPVDKTSAIKIFQSLCRDHNLQYGYNNILLKITDAVTKNIDYLTESEVKLIILETCTQVMKGYHELYNPLFLDLLINQIIKKNYEIECGLVVLNKINHLNHIHLALLKYVTDKLQNDLHIFTRYPKAVTILMQGMANSNYKPSNWKSLANSILKNYRLLPDHVAISYVALYLAALDEIDFKMIKQVFTMDQNPDLLKSKYHETLCELYQIVKTLYPEYPGPWPMDEIINSFKTLRFKYEPTEYPLTPVLNKIVEDPACVRTNVRTNLGHHIDHLVVLQNRSPIAIESNVTSEDANCRCFVEDLNIPEDCVKVAICLLPHEAYGSNIAIPNAKTRMKEKTLKAMSFKVIFISEDTWISMPDIEKIPYLRHVIGVEKKIREDKNSEISLSN